MIAPAQRLEVAECRAHGRAASDNPARARAYASRGWVSRAGSAGVRGRSCGAGLPLRGTDGASARVAEKA